MIDMLCRDQNIITQQYQAQKYGTVSLSNLHDELDFKKLIHTSFIFILESFAIYILYRTHGQLCSKIVQGIISVLIIVYHLHLNEVMDTLELQQLLHEEEIKDRLYQEQEIGLKSPQ